MRDTLYEQLVRRIEGNRQAMNDVADIFTGMIDSSVKKHMKNKRGVPTDINELEAELCRQEIYFRQIELTDGWWKRGTGKILAFLTEDDTPVILTPQFASYTFVHPHTSQLCTLNGKNGVDKLLKTEAFVLTYPLPHGRLTLKDLGLFALKNLNKYDVGYIFLSCLSVILLTMFTPYANKLIFSEVIPSGNADQILPIAVLLVSAALGLIMMQISRNLVVFRIKDKLEYALQTALMSRLLRLPATFFREYSPGDLSNRALSLACFSGLLTEEILSTVLTFLFTAVLFIQFFIYGGQLLFIGIGVLTLLFLFNLLEYFYIAKIEDKTNPSLSKMYGTLFSLISGIQKIKTNGAEFRAYKQWAVAFAPTDKNSTEHPVMSYIATPISYVSQLLPMIVTMWAAYQYNLSLSDYIAYCTVLGIAVSSLNQLHLIMRFLPQITAQCQLCTPILEAVPETKPHTELVKDISGMIQIESLKFRYSDNMPYLFDDFNLTIYPGDYVALVGTSGCGKSTLLRLMLGFEKPEGGSIFYDHYNLEEINKPSLRRYCVNICMQDGQLIEGTILDNILMTSPWLTEKDAWEAARVAALDEDIRHMPQGMNTPISVDGRGVSGGQRQRILLARAIIRNPQIIFLDEATSALDNISQHVVCENLAKLKCTRIVIAHRLSTILSCNRIVVLDKGKVVEEGTFDELLAKNGLFASICQQQGYQCI